MKILILDIEISPVIATVWGLFQQNINIDAIVGNSEVLCWAASWLDGDDVYFSSINYTSKKRMLKAIYDMLEEADAVVTYNGNGFDLKILNKEFALMGWTPPAPYKSIDMLRVVRNQFRFTSNKLNYVAPQLGLEGKTKHPGYSLWLSCMNPKSSDYEESWAIMEEYNTQDVRVLKALYLRLRGWIPNHPSFSALENGHCCPNCGGTNLQKRGTTITTSMSYQRWKCMDKACGKWSRSRAAFKLDRTKQLVGVK